jgi:hypothetical protein
MPSLPSSEVRNNFRPLTMFLKSADAAHADQFGIAGDDGPEMGKRVLPAWIRALYRAAEMAK